MKNTGIIIGFIAGVIVTLILTFLIKSDGSPITVIRRNEIESEMFGIGDEFDQNAMYSLFVNGNELALVTIDLNGDISNMVIVGNNTRAINLKRHDGVFPGHTEVMYTTIKYPSGRLVVIDEDFDGLPETVEDWEKMTIQQLMDPQWSDPVSLLKKNRK